LDIHGDNYLRVLQGVIDTDEKLGDLPTSMLRSPYVILLLNPLRRGED
jgi:hypothetical protein